MSSFIVEGRRSYSISLGKEKEEIVGYFEFHSLWEKNLRKEGEQITIGLAHSILKRKKIDLLYEGNSKLRGHQTTLSKGKASILQGGGRLSEKKEKYAHKTLSLSATGAERVEKARVSSLLQSKRKRRGGDFQF